MHPYDEMIALGLLHSATVLPITTVFLWPVLWCGNTYSHCTLCFFQPGMGVCGHLWIFVVRNKGADRTLCPTVLIEEIALLKS